MDVIDKISNSTDKGTDLSKKYITTSYEYNKLKIFQLITLSVSSIVKLLIIGGLVSFGLIFLAFAMAIGVGDYLNNEAYGYLSVGLLFFVMSVLFLFIRKYIDTKIIQKMSKVFFD